MLIFIPQPKKLTLGEGIFSVSDDAAIGIADRSLYPVALEASELIDGRVGIAVPGIADALTITLAEGMQPGGYRLAIDAKGIRLEASNVAAAFHGVQTLRQIAQQTPPGTWPFLAITDWPDFPDRGVYYDVCRGRVPTLDRLIELVDVLVHYKINQLQLYIEHTFHFRRHPDIGKDASPLTAEDILILDACCRDRHVELVPSLSSFGHLATVLNHPRYRHLAEDWGEMRYQDPAAQGRDWWKGWSITPAREESYVFLKELFDEFLPCFSSDRFNVCCDENYDLGWGQSYELARKIGKGRLYLQHIVRLRDLAAAHGKRIMFWGDIIRHYPELIPEIPRDVTVLDWAYRAKMDFDRVKDFTDTGLPTYGCPSVCGYVTLFPRLHESAENIAGWAAACKKFGAQGILNTDWGDGGHYNFMECAWPGYLYGAEQSWNVDADRASFWARYARLFLNIDAPDFAQAIVELGDVAQTAVKDYYQSLWRHIYFACPGENVLEPLEREASVSTQGRIDVVTLRVDAALGRETMKKLEGLKAVFEKYAVGPDVDPRGVMPYWLFSIDTLLHAAKKLAILGEGGEDTADNRRLLKAEMEALLARFEALWMARNQRSEIEHTREYYRKALAALEGAPVA